MKLFENGKVRVQKTGKAFFCGKLVNVYDVYKRCENDTGYLFEGQFSGKTAKEAYKKYNEASLEC